MPSSSILDLPALCWLWVWLWLLAPGPAWASPLREENKWTFLWRSERPQLLQRPRAHYLCWVGSSHSSAPSTLQTFYKMLPAPGTFLWNLFDTMIMIPPGLWGVRGILMNDALVTMTTMTSVFVQVVVISPVLLTICSNTIWKEWQMLQLRKCLLSQSDNNRGWRKKSRTK